MSTTHGCEEYDFVIRSIPDDVKFKVSRTRLAAVSQVFDDMFACCDKGYVLNTAEDDDRILDLHESAASLSILLCLLNATLEPCNVVGPPSESANLTPIQSIIPDAAIPIPILFILLSLADKYMLCNSVVDILHLHLAAHTSTYPLRVYGYAVERGLDDIAAQASKHLLHPPLSSYTSKDIAVIPTAQAYHKLVLLHSCRIDRLREVLMGEMIFPHGYGECTKHSQYTTVIWEERKKTVAAEVLAGTDVTAEMAEVQRKFDSCETCSRACQAALEMLEYKCAKIPRRVDQLLV
ncbi:hypothetical protein BKA93DRAFT_299412 [Sparassis latifolia]|uniref:BTB domain-containing protein n=1 Tax=Sparassis crispa TaxID=139825 RepID=A0A401G7G8_9APHY|nr:hypothetical protein SCP_0110020 [Sparassis crispa]GBE78120.1 hypothetical protein SCP_0110020 [Sparassis crispa]